MPSLSATAECGVKSLVMEKLKIQRKRLNSIEQARRQRRRHTWSTGLVRWSASSSTYLRDLQPKCVAEQSHKRLHTQSSRNPSPLVQTSARPTPVVHRKVLSNPASLGSQLTSKAKGRSKARNKQQSKDLDTEPALCLTLSQNREAVPLLKPLRVSKQNTSNSCWPSSQPVTALPARLLSHR